MFLTSSLSPCFFVSCVWISSSDTKCPAIIILCLYFSHERSERRVYRDRKTLYVARVIVVVVEKRIGNIKEEKPLLWLWMQYSSSYRVYLRSGCISRDKLYNIIKDRGDRHACIAVNFLISKLLKVLLCIWWSVSAWSDYKDNMTSSLLHHHLEETDLLRKMMMKQNDGNDDYDNDDDGKRRQKTRVENKKKQRKRERWCTPLYCALCMISSLNFQVKSLERKEETILPLLLFHHPFSWCRLMQDEERNEGEAHVGCRDDSHVLHAG